LARQNDLRHGYVKGEPMRFIKGHRTRNPKTLEQAFMEHFVPGQPGECWEWQGPMSTMGYGRVSLNGERILAHRASYLIFNGELPTGMEACHKCDNRPCVNPEHLFAGTQRENNLDAATKGRMAKKLTPSAILGIRTLCDQGAKQNAVAAMYGISPAHVSKIVVGGTWQHALGPIGHSKPRLTPANVVEIRALVAQGRSQSEVAGRFDIDPSNVNHIIKRRSWAHVK
jgi:plasmid maintenance system antidote protein VapI